MFWEQTIQKDYLYPKSKFSEIGRLLEEISFQFSFYSAYLLAFFYFSHWLVSKHPKVCNKMFYEYICGKKRAWSTDYTVFYIVVECNWYSKKVIDEIYINLYKVFRFGNSISVFMFLTDGLTKYSMTYMFLKICSLSLVYLIWFALKMSFNYLLIYCFIDIHQNNIILTFLYLVLVESFINNWKIWQFFIRRVGEKTWRREPGLNSKMRILRSSYI